VFRIGLAIVKIEDLEPGNGTQLVGLIFSERDIVLLLAGHRARLTSGALVNIDDHAIANSA
jgi:hypothetical protein